MGRSWRQYLGLALLALSLFSSSVAVFAQGPQPLPSPLSLEQALLIADEAHPERLLADAALEQARARYQQAGSIDDFELGLTAELRAVEPSDISIFQSHNDSLARINLSKQLYDFGRTAHAEAAAEAALSSREWQLLEVRQQRRLKVMEHFFNVLLADLQFARDNEELAIAFIRYDRAVNRQELSLIHI